MALEDILYRKIIRWHNQERLWKPEPGGLWWINPQGTRVSTKDASAIRNIKMRQLIRALIATVNSSSTKLGDPYDYHQLKAPKK